MTVAYYPGQWVFMMCDFNTGFKPPEMVKYRPVLSISKKRNDSTKLCTVVPLSSSKPTVIRDYHYQFPTNELPKHWREKYEENWLKIDMVTTVGFNRLTLPWSGRDVAGNRIYQQKPIKTNHRVTISNKLSDYLMVKVEKS